MRFGHRSTIASPSCRQPAAATRSTPSGPTPPSCTRLTFNDWEWDKHPTWSPDGAKIAFWSNRDTARRQIWVMNADGSGQRNLSNSDYNDWDPVWVR